MDILLCDFDERLIGVYETSLIRNYMSHAECLKQKVGDDNRQPVSPHFFLFHTKVCDGTAEIHTDRCTTATCIIHTVPDSPCARIPEPTIGLVQRWPHGSVATAVPPTGPAAPDLLHAYLHLSPNSDRLKGGMARDCSLLRRYIRQA